MTPEQQIRFCQAARRALAYNRLRHEGWTDEGLGRLAEAISRPAGAAGAGPAGRWPRAT